MNTKNYKSILVKKTFFISLILTILLSSCMFYAISASAATREFIPLEKEVPWGGSIDVNNPGKFFQSVFNTLLAIAATLAVIMIMYGGVIYMTSDAWTKKDEAKGVIWNAIQGLVLALVSYLILYTINPEILNIRI